MTSAEAERAAGVREGREVLLPAGGCRVGGKPGGVGGLWSWPRKAGGVSEGSCSGQCPREGVTQKHGH